MLAVQRRFLAPLLWCRGSSLGSTLRWTMIWLLTTSLAGLGCQGENEYRQRMSVNFADYGKLPGLKQSERTELRDELARLVEEGATPELLSGSELPDADNAATVITSVFPSKTLRELVAQSEALLPPPGEPLQGVSLERASRFRASHRSAQLAVRDALRRRGCEFAVDFTRGFAADLSFVDATTVCARLELFEAAEHVAADDPLSAVEPIGFAMRLIGALGQVKLVEPRMQTAFLRAEMLEAVDWTVSRRAATQEVYDRLYEMLDHQLTTWPSDAWAWIGDRAVGMHTYEVIRDGRLRWLLTPDEFKLLKEEGVLDQLLHPARRDLEADEWFYLQTMRQMIRVCNDPYYKRRAFFQKLWQDLQARRNAPNFPIVAARILLKDVENGHRIQARDRALCEAWSLALAAASARQQPPYAINPLSGQPYRVVDGEHQITVWNVGDGTPEDTLPVVVPKVDHAVPRGTPAAESNTPEAAPGPEP